MLKLFLFALIFVQFAYSDFSDLLDDELNGFEREDDEQQCSEDGLGPWERMFNAAAQGQLDNVKEIWNSEELEILRNAEGTDINKRISKGQTTAFAACVSGHMETIQFLADELGADLLIRDDHGYDCYYVAAVRGFVKLFKYMLKKELDPMQEY